MPRFIQFAETGGPEVLKFVDSAAPVPASGQVSIRAKALGLNRAESMWRSGNYVEDPRLPARLGYEVAGIVEAVGDDVTGLKEGDAVSTIPAFSQNDYGMYGEVVLAPAYAVVKHPGDLSFTDAASIWMMYVTAYGALIDIARLKAGETVLIPAASSSVGLAAIQICNFVGAVPIALTRTSAKRGKLIEAGAAHVIATEEQDLVAEVMKLTNGKGAQIAFDPVGGPTFAKLVSAIAPGGKIFIYGALSGEPTVLPLLDMIARAPTVHGYMIASTSGNPVLLKGAVEFISKGLAAGALKPVIAKTFAFDQIIDAHHYLESNEQFGKIVVTVP